MVSNKKNFLIKTSTILSVITASFILIIKLYAWIITGSASILATMVDSSLDITSSVLNFLAVRIGLLPPDNNHRFGHDKILDLAVLGQGSFFVASGIFVIISAIMNFGHASQLANLDVGFKVMIISTITTLALIAFQTYVIKITNSTIIKADKLHYITDLFSNFFVILSIYLSQTYKFLDSIFAIFIAIYLMYGATSLIITSLKNLLDEEFDIEEKAIILNILKKYKDQGKIYSAHDIKTRKAGNKHFIQLHLELNKDLRLYESHIIVEEIEHDILLNFPEVEIIMHQDPAGIDENVEFKDELNVSK